MSVKIDGAVVLVTGASSGIGEALARQLAPRAATLILVARRVDRLETLAAELRGVARSAQGALEVELEPCDLADPAATDALAERVLGKHGAVDVLINNAGMGDVGLFERSEMRRHDMMIGVNVSGLVRLTHRLLPPMLQQRRGGVLMISSGFGLQFMPGVAVYAATKHFVTGFTESLRLELAGTGVEVSQVCPGPVATEFEAVAGNPTGQEVPGWIRISAEQCARESLAGFERGRALIVPGLVMRLVMLSGAWTPRWILRLMYRPIGGYLRRRPA
jgi:short-subunit dehydrogenase